MTNHQTTMENIKLFLEELAVEGILDSIEQDARENLLYHGQITKSQYTYVKETMELWDDEEYFRRLEIVNG